METIFLSIAGYIIAVRFEEPEIIDAKKKYLNGFIKYHKNFIYKSIPEKIDFEIEIIWDGNQEIVMREKEGKYFINYCNRVGRNKIKTYYQTSIYQFQIILRDIVQELLSKTEGYIFHASSTIINDQVHVFIGSSGAGKSTIASLASKKYRVFTDDVLIVKKEEGKYWCYQSPLLEKNIHFKKKQNRKVLHSISILKKEPHYRKDIIKNKHSIFKHLARQLYTTKHDNKKQLESLFRFTMKENIYYFLSFGKDAKQVIKLLEE